MTQTGTCPVCGTLDGTRRDGTMWWHTLLGPSMPTPNGGWTATGDRCPGTGTPALAPGNPGKDTE